MRSILRSTFRWSVLASLCVAVAIVTGCARPEPVAKVQKPKSLFVDSKGKQVLAPKKPTGDAKIEKQKGPKLTVTQQGVTLRWDQKDGTQMTASAKSGSFNEITQVGTVLDFSAKLYENGKLTASMHAPKATIDTAKRVVLATGGVVLKSLERQTVVNASWIKWSANTHKIIGNGGVKIRSANGTADAAAFTADTSLRNYTLLSSGKGLE